MPSFSGINLALQSILTHQQAIDIIEHNVSNANTPGYHREEAVLAAGPSYTSGMTSSTSVSAAIGTGVVMSSVRRYNVDFMDTRYRSEQANYKQWSTEASYMQQIEDSAQETGDSGMSAKLDAVWSSWKAVATTPEDTALRATLLENSKDLANTFHSRISNLTEIQKETNTQVLQRVDEINQLATKVANLNNQIGGYNSPDTTPNDFLDQQSTYLDRIAEISGAKITIGTNGQAMVSIGGHVLVQGISTFTLSTQTNSNDFLDVKWGDGQSLQASSGELAGLVDLRDNVIGAEKDKLNTLAATVFTNINNLQHNGYGLTDPSVDALGNPIPNGTPNPNGVDFFTVSDPNNFAATIQVNSVLEDVNKIAAAQDPGVKGDGRVAENIAILQDATTTAIYKYDPTANAVVATGQNESINSFNSTRVANTGLTIDRINTLSSQHKNLVNVMNTQRESTTGVSLDEEAANLVKYQNSYNASIRLMSAVDDMLSRVIDKMGTGA